MSETVLIPGGRDVRASLDRSSDSADPSTVKPDPSAAETDTDALVVACPPDPRQRGHRGDERLVAVSDALTARGVDCLRFDYGTFDEGYGECTDADNAVAWALERYDRVGLFGFSFGGSVALVTAASRPELVGVCALAPAARLNADVDAVAAVGDLEGMTVPVRVVYGTRDGTADWSPVVERAREAGFDLVGIEGDHFFVGQSGTVADSVADWLVPLARGMSRD